MTRNAPTLRKSVSNADLYSDPSPPRNLRHAYSNMNVARANTTASHSYNPPRGMELMEERRNKRLEERQGMQLTEERRNIRVVPPGMEMTEERRNKWVERPGMELTEERRNKNRHSLRRATPPSYGQLIDVEDDVVRTEERQVPPPVPPKILEEVVEEKTVRVGTNPWGQASVRFESQAAPVVRSKEGPEKYTKPFTDFMTAKYDLPLQIRITTY
jgi:aminopeptidase I